MNKKLIITLALIITISFTGINFTNASTESNILPNNPFYFFKDLGRNIQDFLTFDSTQKVELRLQVANEKLAEIEKIAETNPNSSNYEKYLQGYETAITKVKEKINSIDTKNAEDVLNNITSTMINNEERLEELKNVVRTESGDAFTQTKNSMINNYTETSLQIVDKETLQNRIEIMMQNMNEEAVKRIEEEAPENLKNILNNVEIIQKLREATTNDDMINKVTENAQKIGLTPTKIISELSTLSEEDKEKLEQYALEIITGNKSEKDIATDFEDLNLSTDALEKLNNLKTISMEKIREASDYCSAQGNKVITEGVNIICVSPLNEKCEIMSYLNKDCLLK